MRSLRGRRGLSCGGQNARRLCRLSDCGERLDARIRGDIDNDGN